MADQDDLNQRGFRSCWVKAKTLNIAYDDPAGHGPFCRLTVEDTAPTQPGVYAWVQDGEVMYVGKAKELRQIVHGMRMGRAYNDYTYIPPSKVLQTSNPRVRVNGLLNRALCGGSAVTWWWLSLLTIEDSSALEARLINEWNPPWNRARPLVR